MKPRGWFIPHRYAPLLPPPGAQPPYPAIEQPLRGSRLAGFAAVLDAVDAAGELPSKGCKALLDQSWFPSLDAAVAYALVRDRKPRHIVEVGSGHSTRLLSKAVGGPRRNPGDRPGAARGHRRPAGRPRRSRRPCRRRPPTVLRRVACRDDIAVHRLQPYPDARQRRRHPAESRPAEASRPARWSISTTSSCRYDYPAIWGWRAYNEQQGVVPSADRPAPIQPLFASAWAERRTGRPAGRLGRWLALPRPPDAMPASLWLEKRWDYDAWPLPQLAVRRRGNCCQLPDRVQRGDPSASRSRARS